MALPKYLYRDPEESLVRMEAGDVYRRERCAACVSFDMRRHDDPCKKRISPGKNWCKGFDEK